MVATAAGPRLRLGTGRQPVLLLVVLGVHALLVLLMSLAVQSPERPASPQRVEVRLLPITPTAAPPAPPPPTVERSPPPRKERPERVSIRPPRNDEPRAAAPPPASPAPRPEPPTAFSAPTVPAAPPPAASQAASPGEQRSARPLDLRLPPSASLSGSAPRSMAQQAVEQQIGGRPTLSAEARLSRRLETTWTEENLGDGRIRLRRGNECVILKETVASQLDPWNRAGPPPRGAGPCP